MRIHFLTSALDLLQGHYEVLAKQLIVTVMSDVVMLAKR